MSLMYSILKPLKTLNTSFVAFRLAVQRKLRFNAQIIYLEHFLNDLYDPANKGIYIEDLANLELAYVFNHIEERPALYLYNDFEQIPVYLFNNSEQNGQVEYIVRVPTDVVYNELLMRKQIQTYNIAGKRFEIKTY